MAKKNKPKPAPRPDPSQALEQIERPSLNWKILGQIGIGFAVLWVVAFMVQPVVGYWGVGVVGVLTLVALGFGLYAWRMMRRSSAIVDILKTAKDADGRKQALEQLRAQATGEGKDAMNALAQAQLLAQDDPGEALRLLEAVDIAKAPTVLQDDLRTNRALLYLVLGRPRDARPLVDDVVIERQPQPKARVMYAAVCAETFARTGKADEAMKLLEKYRPDDPESAELRPLLLRAQVYASIQLKKRGLAKTAMEKLAGIDPNALAPFVQKSANPELRQIAQQVLMGHGVIPKQRIRPR